MAIAVVLTDTMNFTVRARTSADDVPHTFRKEVLIGSKKLHVRDGDDVKGARADGPLRDTQRQASASSWTQPTWRKGMQPATFASQGPLFHDNRPLAWDKSTLQEHTATIHHGC